MCTTFQVLNIRPSKIKHGGGNLTPLHQEQIRDENTKVKIGLKDKIQCIQKHRII